MTGGRDTLCDPAVTANFVKRFSCRLRTAETAEHWFHTEEDLSALRTKKDRLLEMSIEGVISRLEFKQRNDGFNQQAQALEGRLPVRAHRMACGSGSGVA